MKKLILIFISSFLSGQVGINTDAPTSTLDVRSDDASANTKALRVVNSAPIEIITIQNNGNMGINSSTVANNTAQLNVDSGALSKSVLKLNNISNTKDRTVSSINYNNYSNLVIDNSGNVYKQYNIRTTATAAITFDGIYSATSTEKKLIDLNGGSIVKFQIMTDFVLGNTSNGGAVLYADITWSRNQGFTVTTYGYENSAGTNIMSVTNVTTGTGVNTVQTLTFDFATGADLVINARLTGSPGAGSLLGSLNYSTANTSLAAPFNVYSSFRSR